ncbi:hypothetical protein [Treponema primitia]|uniref:hypothetical protein n=1 Tax=Treponema primitia TaxID=88058 RepID=UPI0002554F7D|nr:hypothetical protein [Treponema primitia]
MVISRKAVLSLLISVVLFAGFSALTFTGLFELVETRFYNPAVTKAVSREIAEDTEVIEKFLEELQIRFAATLQEDAVRRSFLSNLEGEDIVRRANIYGTLLESLGGFQSVRFIDAAGSRIHYSTWQPDILRQNQTSIAYRNYNDTRSDSSSGYIPYWQIEVPDRGDPRLILDEAGERILFSHPFYDSFEVYRGTAIFSLSVRAVMEQMVTEGRIKVGEDVTIISEPPGMVTGLPFTGKSTLIPLISQVWSENILSLGRLKSGLTETNLALISEKTSQGIYIGRLVNESILSFPLAMRIILLASFLITVYLIIFLLLNIRQDNMTIIQNRLKRLQINLIEEYYEHKGDFDLNHWRKELEQRKEDVHSELKRGIKAEDPTEIDVFIDKSWEDLLAIIGGRAERRTAIDEEKLKTILNRFLATAPVISPPSKPAEEMPGIPIQTPPSTPDLEELEEAEAIDEIGAMEDIQHESASTEMILEEVSLETLEVPEYLEELEGEEPVQTEELAIEEPVVEVEPELEELEEIEPLEAIPEFEQIDASELGGSDDTSDKDMSSLASEIEFSPVPEEVEKAKEEAAESMVDDFEIQSPFTAIFSALSEVEFEPEPSENLESLEKEGLIEPDDSLEAEAEPLNTDFVKPLLSKPFFAASYEEIEILEAQAEDETPVVEDAETALEEEKEIIAERDGISYINESILNPDEETLKSLDRNFKNLIDSVLND